MRLQVRRAGRKRANTRRRAAGEAGGGALSSFLRAGAEVEPLARVRAPHRVAPARLAWPAGPGRGRLAQALGELHEVPGRKIHAARVGREIAGLAGPVL